jgi:N6-adenosine-specific RNA methylase IME4
MSKFGVVLADPPWRFITHSPKGLGRSAEQHYDCMSLQYLMELPVQGITNKDCVLMLWTTWPMLASGAAHDVIRAWGFEGKSGFPWLKLSKDMLPRMGNGYHTRSVSEIMMIATKGHPPAPEPWEREEGVLFSKLGAHSAKPDTIYNRAEKYDGPYCELFARPDGALFPPREGWTQLGNEITGNDMEKDLIELALKGNDPMEQTDPNELKNELKPVFTDPPSLLAGRMARLYLVDGWSIRHVVDNVLVSDQDTDCSTHFSFDETDTLGQCTHNKSIREVREGNYQTIKILDMNFGGNWLMWQNIHDGSINYTPIQRIENLVFI